MRGRSRRYDRRRTGGVWQKSVALADEWAQLKVIDPRAGLFEAGDIFRLVLRLMLRPSTVVRYPVAR